MKVITRGWPPERRKAQAERIRQTQPWLHSTGPTGKEGKNRSAQNSVTHGMTSENGKRLRKVLGEHRQMTAWLEMLTKMNPPASQEGGDVI